jgi:mandelate racemase
MNNGRSTPPALTIRDLRTVAVEVPMTIPLGTSAATIRDVPLVLIDVETEEGLIGRTYLFCYRRSGARAITEILQDMADVVKGQRAAPVEIVSLLARSFALIGVTGVVRMALSGLDAALWDALATAAGVPLASFLAVAPDRFESITATVLA